MLAAPAVAPLSIPSAPLPAATLPPSPRETTSSCAAMANEEEETWRLSQVAVSQVAVSQGAASQAAVLQVAVPYLLQSIQC